MAHKAVGVITVVVVMAVVLLVSVPIIDPLVTEADQIAGGSTAKETNVRIDSGTGLYSIDDDTGVNETVFLSRGNAVRLAGTSDSFVQSKTSFTFASDASWTVTTWARVNSSSGSENMTAVSLNGRVLIQFNGSQGNWSVFYFDEGSRNSFRANVSAPDQPGNLTMVTARHNGTHLTIFQNTTQGDVVSTDVDQNTADIQINSTNWHGTIEETRTFDEALNSSQRTALFNEPVQPLPNATRTGRLMYDEGTGTTTFIIFADIDADVSNVTWVSGHPAVTLTEGADYNWQVDGPTLEVLAGGELADAPIAWVDYDHESQANEFGRDFADVLDLAAAVLALIVAGVVIFVLTGLD